MLLSVPIVLVILVLRGIFIAIVCSVYKCSLDLVDSSHQAVCFQGLCFVNWLHACEAWSFE